ncbi:MAG: sulfite reductase subunit A [Actinobacteria bacterium]|nr:sulfite reductase subunit A [Actinomycetota bacterium]
MSPKVVGADRFDSLISLLQDRGYTVIGPTIHERTIVYDKLDGAGDLPIGWTDQQDAGTYRLVRRDDDAYFGHAVGPRTLKSFLFPPRQTLLTAEHAEAGLEFHPEPPADSRYAFIGVRACELAAVAIQDKVLLGSAFRDPHYASARNGSFTVAVNCAVAGATCFCASMGTGPRCERGYDLVVTEVLEPDRHEFIIESGSDAGSEILDALEGRAATKVDLDRVEAIVGVTEAHMGRTMPNQEVYELLTNGLEHPMWESIARRCLSCTNCTLVCPTCFCSTVEDSTDLKGTASRRRTWDSCFGLDFSSLHGHAVRSSSRSRYRQWMTHKLAYWYDQFGTSGCVGCGRCITWCPVGIDITAEIDLLRNDSEVTV